MGKLGTLVIDIVAETLFPIPMFRDVCKSGQTLGNISEKRR
jgi:hypothetical protein